MRGPSMSRGAGSVDQKFRRRAMVRNQLRAKGIRDEAVLAAMGRVKRHEFVEEALQAQAYSDNALPIGYGQTISPPFVVARMSALLQVESGDRVLEVGTGSGYQAAVLAQIVDSVYTIEIVRELFASAKKRLKAAGYDNVLVKYADGYHGWPEKGPFDAIIVTAAAEFVPPPLIEQLKEGGRMIIPVGNPFSTQQLLEVVKENGKSRTKNLMFVRFVPFTRSDSEK